MALFIKHTDTDTNLSMIYNTGLEQAKLIVGLGNPGKQYLNNRHNVGFRCLETFAEHHGQTDSWDNKNKFQGLVNVISEGDRRIILFQPQTFMNNSGQAVDSILKFYKLTCQDLTVIHDDIDVGFGIIKTKFGGGSSGHNGLASIMAIHGEDFSRIRVGIGPKKPLEIDLSSFVLKDFTSLETKGIPALVKEVNTIIIEASVGILGAETYHVLPQGDLVE